MRDLVVDKKYDNKKLSKLLLDTYPALKYGTFVKALKKKDILIRTNKYPFSVGKNRVVREYSIFWSAFGTQFLPTEKGK